ncbi:MAG: amidohydrolase [Proteobacteria bacterium]|nr:amidohydrolase [Pseudomonadota bacterium]
MLKRIIKATDEIKDRLIKFRREVHQNPELSGQEEKIAAFVATILEDNDIELQKNVGGHGVVGRLKGFAEGPIVALRADMDALPIEDTKKVDYASKSKGIMHACGHDAHTAILLGVAIVLGKLRNEFKGEVIFIFQPAEESIQGAERMIKDGVLDSTPISAIAALHCLPELEAGKIGHRAGIMTSAADRIAISIKGKSGHASKPQQTVDAVLVSSMVINALHHIVSRRTDPLQPSVISIGTIRGGTAENIIADKVKMTGTVRTLDAKLRQDMPRMIENVIKGITASMNAGYDFDYTFECPSILNNKEVDGEIRRCATDVVGSDNVIELAEPMMGSEDFALFTEKIPGALFRLGTGKPGDHEITPLHSNTFDIDESAIAIGTKILAWWAVSSLKR